MSVSTSALYAIMFLCAAFVFSFLFRVLRALLLHAALLSPLPRRSDDPDSTIHVRTVLVIDGVPEGTPARAGEGEAGGAGGGTRGKGLRAEEIAEHSDLIRYSEVKEERRVEDRELVVVEIGEREEREQGWESEKARAGKEGGAKAACEGEGQRGADREAETARAAAAVNGQGSENAERQRDRGGASETTALLLPHVPPGVHRRLAASPHLVPSVPCISGAIKTAPPVHVATSVDTDADACRLVSVLYRAVPSAMDLGILLAFAVMVASMILVCAYRLCRVILAEEQAERARERERALREMAARSRLAEALDPKLLGAFSDLVTYADVKVSRDADVKVARDADVMQARGADVKLARDADARGSAPSSSCTTKGSVTLTGLTVAGEKLPRDDESCVGDDSSLQEDGTTVVVDIRVEGSEAGGTHPTMRDHVIASCDQTDWGIEDGSSAVQGEEATAWEGTQSQEGSGAGADSRAMPSPHAGSKRSSPMGGERQGLLLLAGQVGFAAVAGSGGTGGPSEVAIPVTAVTAAECSVCLVELEDADILRRMHCCRHLFHQVSMEGGQCWGMGPRMMGRWG
ncbi:unnamed protein product [Closterium sp. Yama58-4]|nr:unnamed protein product [Closterium sp. Yama58-4]